MYIAVEENLEVEDYLVSIDLHSEHIYDSIKSLTIAGAQSGTSSDEEEELWQIPPRPPPPNLPKPATPPKKTAPTLILTRSQTRPVSSNLRRKYF
jgi:hypothetical protein